MRSVCNLHCHDHAEFARALWGKLILLRHLLPQVAIALQMSLKDGSYGPQGAFLLMATYLRTSDCWHGSRRVGRAFILSFLFLPFFSGLFCSSYHTVRFLLQILLLSLAKS